MIMTFPSFPLWGSLLTHNHPEYLLIYLRPAGSAVPVLFYFYNEDVGNWITLTLLVGRKMGQPKEDSVAVSFNKK